MPVTFGGRARHILGIGAALLALWSGPVAAFADREACVALVDQLTLLGPRYADTARQTFRPGPVAIDAAEVGDLALAVAEGCLLYDYEVPEVCSDLTAELEDLLQSEGDKVQAAAGNIEANLRRLEEAGARYPATCSSYQSPSTRAEAMQVTAGYVETFQNWLARLTISRNHLVQAQDRLEDVKGRVISPRMFVPSELSDDEADALFSAMRRIFAGNSGAYGVGPQRVLVRTGLASGLQFDPSTGHFRIETSETLTDPASSGGLIAEQKHLAASILDIEIAPVIALKITPEVEAAGAVRTESLGAHAGKPAAALLRPHISDPMLILRLRQDLTTDAAPSVRIPFRSASSLNEFARNFLKLQSFFSSRQAEAATRQAVWEARLQAAEELSPVIKNATFFSDERRRFTNAETELDGITRHHCAWDRKFRKTLSCRVEHWIVDRGDPLTALGVLSLELTYDRRADRQISHTEFRWFNDAPLGALSARVNDYLPVEFVNCADGRCANSPRSQAENDLRRALTRDEEGTILLSGTRPDGLSILQYTIDLEDWAAGVAYYRTMRERYKSRF